MDTKESRELVSFSFPPSPRWQFIESPVGQHFPIMGIGKRVYHNPDYNSAVSTSQKFKEYNYLDKETLQLMKDCGVNIAQAVTPYNKYPNPSKPTDIIIPAALNENLTNCYISAVNCGKVGIKCLLRIGNPTTYTDTEFAKWKTYWTNVVNEFYNYESVAGWMLWDEPSTSIFPLIKTYLWNTIKNLDVWNKLRFINLYPLTTLDNLFGEGHESKLTPWEAYTKYTKDYGSTFEPQIFCFDSYPFSHEYKINKSSAFGKTINPANNRFPDISKFEPSSDKNLEERISNNFNKEYIGMLDALRYRAKERNVTFWITLGVLEEQKPVTESGSYYNITIDNMPSLLYWKFQIYCALAYGAQGVCYWAMTRRSNESDCLFLSAPIEIEDSNNNVKKGSSYTNLQSISNLIRKWERVFLNCDARYCAPVAPAASIKEMGGSVHYFDVNNVFSLIQSISYKGKGFLVSMIHKDDNDFVVFVNLDYENSQSLTVKFKYDMFDMADHIDSPNHTGWSSSYVVKIEKNKNFTVSIPMGEMKVYRVL